MDMTSDLSLQESCMAALRHMGVEVRALVDKTDELEAKNERLRELVRKWYPHMLKRVGRDALAQWGQLDVLREMGIEVDG